MSLSESERELLLSASLDGALSPEEQSLLDQWLREDPAAQRQRDEYVAMTRQLKATLSASRRVRLGEGFANRVVDAAIAQAERENLPPTHPLVRLARRSDQTAGSDPADSEARSAARLRWRHAAACLALAASLMLVIYAGRALQQGGQVALQRIADVDAVAENSANTTDNSANATDIGEETDTRIAATGGDLPGDHAVPKNIDNHGDETRVDVASTAGEDGSRSVAMATTDDASEVEPQALQLAPLAAVMVMSVERTQEGRDSLALLEALRSVDIRIGPAGIASEEVVTHLKQSGFLEPAEESEPAKLYFIEASAKQIDRFLLRLMADKEAFASFGLGIAEDPPLLASVSDLRVVDPAKLRHANSHAIARDLVPSDGKPLVFDRGPAVIPYPREMGAQGLVTSAADVDFPSQLLLHVR